MLDNIKIINIGRGLGTLTFGNSKEQVLALLGEPSEREKYTLSDLESDDTEAWHYDDLDLSLSFDEENDWRLSSMAVSSDDYTLDGVPLIGKNKEEIIEFFTQKGLTEMEEDEEVRADNPENCLLHIDKASISLWFESNHLTEMQIGPYFNTDGVSN
ncbi:MAG TPA: hypothetical protein PL009_08370 [Flavipsychrobacter sp.]|nr:hypothetical protein [Flavipsychrobacter sp.]